MCREGRTPVIWTRFSSDMQRTESCKDQEQKVREGLNAQGIDHADARVIRVEAVSGTRTDGVDFSRLMQMIRDGEVGVLPSDEWVREQVDDLRGVLSVDTPGAAALLRTLITEVTAHEIRIPGKTRGYTQLSFRIDGFRMLEVVTDGRVNAESLRDNSADDGSGNSPEYQIDLGQPSRLDLMTPRIVELREQGVSWNEIARATGLRADSAWTAWKRWASSRDDVSVATYSTWHSLQKSYSCSSEVMYPISYSPRAKDGLSLRS